MSIWLLAVPIIAVIVISVLSAHRIRARRFSGREDVSFDQVYSQSFQSLGVHHDISAELWSEAATTLRISAAKLRPTDRFDVELRHHLTWLPFVDLNDDFYWAAVGRLKRLKADKKLFEEAKSLGDYVVTFARLEATAKQARHTPSGPAAGSND